MGFIQYKLNVKFILFAMFLVCSEQSDSALAVQNRLITKLPLLMIKKHVLIQKHIQFVRNNASFSTYLALPE